MDKTLPHDHHQPVETVLANMPDTGRFAQAAAVFQQVSDGSRLRIFWFLCHCEECVSDIAAAMGMSSAAVSHHLKSLRMHGLITSRRVGKEMHYTLADTVPAKLLHRLIEDYLEMNCPL